MSTQQYWKNFWQNQSTPLHRYNSEEWYRMYAEEINLILKSLGYNQGPVLETGCGNGALFDYLDINKKDYMGTDLSENLVSIFRKKHPDVTLICTDSCEYICPHKVSLIFSNGVGQYFDKSMMELYINNSLSMLDENGILLLANLPWKDLKIKLYSGELSKNPSSSLVKSLIFFLANSIKKDSMGCWYNPKDFFAYKKPGLDIYIYGSLFHPYRFSIGFKKTNEK